MGSLHRRNNQAFCQFGKAGLVDHVAAQRQRQPDADIRHIQHGGGVGELQRMGADITLSGRIAVVEGKNRLQGAAMKATDLRGGAAMVIAALAAEGTSEIGDVHHIDRGYEKIEEVLSSVGAQMIRE